MTVPGPTGPPDPSHVPVISPRPASAAHDRSPRRWLPWVVIVVVTAATLGIVLALTLGSSSSITTPTPTSPSTSPGTLRALTGSYYSPTVQDSSLLFLRLVQLQTSLSGVLTVTAASATHARLVEHRYTVTGSVQGTAFKVTIGTGSTTVFGTYLSGVLQIVLAGGTKLSLHRGTLATYRALVVRDRALLLG